MMPKISNLPAGQSIFSPAVGIFSVTQNIAWDVETAQNAVHIATENSTLSNPTNMTSRAGKVCVLRYVQNDTSPMELAFGDAYTNPANLPLVSTALGAVDIFYWYCTGTTMELWNYAQNVGA